MSASVEKKLHYNSCTPHRPKTRYHIVFEDFVDISIDIYNAHALRAFENATNQRITSLRETYGIPETCLPHEDDLWVSMPYRAIEALTLKAVTKSTCQRILAEEAVEDAPPSLVELGFIRRRFAARRTNESRQRPLTTIYKDSDGEFILVDESGNFIDLDGLEQSAMMYGFCLIERQYLYCIESINAAIAALDGLEPPQPMPRCDEPLMRRCVPRQKSSVAAKEAAQETTKNSCDAQRDANNRRSLARRGTNPNNTISVIAHDSTKDEGMSREISENLTGFSEPVSRIKQPVKPLQLIRDTIDHGTLRAAFWTPETLIGLTSFVLDVPVRPVDDDEEALRQWLTDWYEPACWLLIATKDLDPRRAWEKIERHIRGMIGGPTWYATKRTTPDPITLRNVVGPADPAKPLNGHNWRVVEAELDRAAWYPEKVIEYDGPPLELEYEEGYESLQPPAPVVEAGQITAITEVSDQGNEEQRTPVQAEVVAVPQVRSLTRRAAEGVADTIHRECPGLLLGLDEVAAGRFMVFFEYGPDDQWEPIDLVTWYAPPPALKLRIEEALRYAATVYGGGSSPPQVESEEPSAQQGENRADHRAGAVQTALGPS